MARISDRNWGDLWLTDEPRTRITQAQAEVLAGLGKCEAGASEVRFGDAVGDLLAITEDGRWVEIGPDGSTEDVTAEVISGGA